MEQTQGPSVQNDSGTSPMLKLIHYTTSVLCVEGSLTKLCNLGSGSCQTNAIYMVEALLQYDASSSLE